MAEPFRKHGHWYIKWKDAKGDWQIRRTSAKNKAEARGLVTELEAKVERQRLGLEAAPIDCKLTLGELCDWWLAERCTERSRKVEANRLKNHVKAHAIASLALPEVTAAVIEERLREMAKEGASAASQNHLRRKLHTVFAKAIKASKYAGPNPAAGVEHRKVPKRAYDTLKAEEVPLLLAQVPEDWTGVFATAVYTAMRKGEIFGLLKSDVDLDNRIITVARSYEHDTTKGGHADAIPIASGLVPYLQTAIKLSTGPWVFAWPDGTMRDEAVDVAGIMKHALARAGLVEGYEHRCRRCISRFKKGLIREAPHIERHPDAGLRTCPTCEMKLWPKTIPRRVRFHDLRHTTATLLLRAGIDPHRVQRLLRHQDVRTTTGIYGHLLVEDLRPAVESLGLPPAPPPPEPEPQRESAAGEGELRSFGPPVVREGFGKAKGPERQGANPAELRALLVRTCRDSNAGPLASEANALSS